jgi:nitroreductase
MDAIEALLTRRSIRKYAPNPVSDTVVKQLLQAAMSAPSAGNEQPWQFIVITERNIMEEIARFHPYAAMLREAPLAILVCGDLDLQQFKGNWVLDCSAATQNLLLAAHALGLGAVWVGVYPETERMEDLKKLLHLPQQIIPLSLVPVGYPAESPPPEDRYDTTRVRYNRW